MKIMKMIKWLGKQNIIIKPLSVLLNMTAPLFYVLHQTQDFVIEIKDSETILVSYKLLTGFQGSIVLLFIVMSILQVYKPPKSVIISITLGGIMIFASSLFVTLGIALMLFGLSNLINRYTLDKLVTRNDNVKKYKKDMEIERLARGE